MLLNCHTHYSFCYGIFSVDELLEHVQRAGYSEFVLADINNTSACLETIRLSGDKGLKPIVGIDFRNGVQQQYVGIACNNAGFRELNEHLSRHLHSEKPFDPVAPEFSNCFVVYPMKAYKGWALRENEFIGVSVRELPALPFSPVIRHIEKCVALQPATFMHQQQFNMHRLLRAIDKNTLWSKLEKSEQASTGDVMLSRAAMEEAYKIYPSIIRNTRHVLDSSGVRFEYGKFANKNLKHYTRSMQGDAELLRQECEKGLAYRYKNPSREILDRMEKELEIIGQMNFASYFLINWDIVRYAQHRNYYYVGRGSGANSLVAYLLRITDVDPVDLDLYFERFINPFRSTPPDFDVDFSWTDRDDMTRYIFDRFGREHTALLGAYNTFQHDAVIRELGKVFGLPPGEIDRLQAVDHPEKADRIGQGILKYSRLIGGFPSHLSIHSSGLIISEEPVTAYSATSMPPKGYPTTQFSMLEAEDIGLCKFDILSQRGLGKIKDALDVVKTNKGVEIDIHDINRFKEDEQVKELLRTGKTIGCFYVESPAMRMLLAKLRADDYLRLVAASSIIRPGVAKSGMMREYILRYREPKRREEARERLPVLYDLLQETYGVMVYQEDVIKVAHYFAGLTLAEADYLRRGMSWKFKQRNEFWRVRDKFFGNCRSKGYAEALIQDTWTQIESFANYAFSKGHSASYAVESFQAMFLKAHYPLEYMVATLNNGGGFYRAELYAHEARMHGGLIVQPCINNSDALWKIEGTIIYPGLGIIAGLEEKTIRELITERQKNGPFASLPEFCKRVPISIEQSRLLIRAGAFSFTGISKKKLLWEAHLLANPAKKKEQELFEVPPKSWSLPALSKTKLDDALDELALFGFPLSTPFGMLRDEMPSMLTASDLKYHTGKTVSIVGYLISIKPTMTSKGDRMSFGTFIDREGHWIDTVHFPPSLRQHPFTGNGCYLLTGKVVEEYDFLSLEVAYQKRLPIVDAETLEGSLAKQ